MGKPPGHCLSNCKGNTTCEYPVEPYYLIKNEKFSINGNTLKANFDIEKITDGAKISTAFLFSKQDSIC